MARLLLCLAAALTLSHAAELRAGATARAAANPIRKVVMMLQNMEKKITAEGETEKELYEKYMCWCKTSGGGLSKSIADAETKISSLPSEIEAAEELMVQVKDGLKQSQEDRTAAKAAMADATAIREKEAATFASLKAEYEANIGAITKAVAALEKGMAGAFLQTDAAKVLQKVFDSKREMDENNRDAILSFLSGDSSYAPSSGEITGILKEMGDEMGRGLAAATAEETDAIKVYDELMAAKTKEVEACTASIEAKTQKIGELGIEIVEMKEDLSDTEKGLEEDKKFLADLEKNCATKEAEYAVVVKTRAEELTALADTIKVLNDDDALELFKKTLPSAGSSFLQVTVNAMETRKRALAVVHRARVHSKHRAQFDLIALALTGKKISFDKVLAMIDEMVAMLKQEQLDDDHKKEYCVAEFDVTDDKKKALERTMSLESTAIDKAKEAIATLTEEMAALEAGIVALDKAVAEATEQRKEEHEDYTDLMASDTAAKELLGFAKNRLNKFYNPKLYKPPPKRTLSAEDEIVTSMGGTLAPTNPPGGIAGTGIALVEVSAHVQRKDAPPPPPEAVGAYKKSSEEGTGVISMIDLMIKDLDKELTEATTGEEEAQKDYESMMADSAEKRALDTKTLAEKAEVKASTEKSLQDHSDSLKAATSEHMATLEYETALHADCDWLMKYFDVRKEARDGEIDSLKKAKDVLSGADYSLLQKASTQRTRTLRGQRKL
jgi:septal ring factor EnvC (AmiA/AmiB activator)